MVRIGTARSFDTVTTAIMGKLFDQVTAQNQVSSGKIAQDLSGYGVKAQSLAATNSARAKTESSISVLEDVGRQLDSQDLYMTKLGDSAGAAKQAIINAVALGSGVTVLKELQIQFSNVVDALNAQHEGKYLFSGSKFDTKAVNVSNLYDLGPVTVASVFQNDDLALTSQFDGASTITTGFLASDLGTQIMTAFKNIQDYVDLNGDFSSPLTTAQSTFLTSQITVFETARSGITYQTAANGAINANVQSNLKTQNDRRDFYDGVIGQISDVNEAEAISRVQRAQAAVQASAEVFNALKSSSLLNFLR